MIVAINACWKVRAGCITGTAGGADPTSDSTVVQAGGTDNGPSEAALPTPADGAPTPDEG